MNRLLPWVCPSAALLALAACGRESRTAPPDVLATAMLGPAGGVLAVDQGPQAGLRLVVPAGALLEATELRVETASPLPAGLDAVSAPPEPGAAFTLAPVGLRFEVLATLRAPYRVEVLAQTAPGNVRVRRLLGVDSYDLDPTAVDVVAGYVEVPLRTLGRHRVVRGPVASGIADYRPLADGVPVALADGFTFTAAAVTSGPFATPTTVGWRLAGPGVDDQLFFTAGWLAGRESSFEGWREVWSQAYDVWTHGNVSMAASLTMPTAVQQPIGSPPLGGQITVFGLWTWEPPLQVGDRLLCDVARLRVTLAWSRADLGVGQREYLFWLTPGLGLVGFAQDGVARMRQWQ